MLMAMWMGLPVGVRRACPTAQCRQQADIWGVHGGMTCGGASEGHAVRSAMARRHNELAKQLWAAQDRGHPSHAGAAGMGWVKETAG